jgi:hypothetical protein
VFLRNALVMGLAGAVPEGCCATRLAGRRRARIANEEVFIESPEVC